MGGCYVRVGAVCRAALFWNAVLLLGGCFAWICGWRVGNSCYIVVRPKGVGGGGVGVDPD